MMPNIIRKKSSAAKANSGGDGALFFFFFSSFFTVLVLHPRGIDPHVVHRRTAGSGQCGEPVVINQGAQIEDWLERVILNADGHSDRISTAAASLKFRRDHDIVSSQTPHDWIDARAIYLPANSNVLG